MIFSRMLKKITGGLAVLAITASLVLGMPKPAVASESWGIWAAPSADYRGTKYVPVEVQPMPAIKWQASVSGTPTAAGVANGYVAVGSGFGVSPWTAAFTLFNEMSGSCIRSTTKGFGSDSSGYSTVLSAFMHPTAQQALLVVKSKRYPGRPYEPQIITTSGDWKSFIYRSSSSNTDPSAAETPVAIDSAGNIYVGWRYYMSDDSGTDDYWYVQAFNSAGSSLWRIDTTNNPWGPPFRHSGTYLYMRNNAGTEIRRLNPSNGGTLNTWSLATTSFALASGERFYYINGPAKTVGLFNANTGYVTWSVTLAETPVDLAVDASDRVYVLVPGYRYIFDASGTQIAKHTTNDSAYTTILAVDKAGTTWLTKSGATLAVKSDGTLQTYGEQLRAVGTDGAWFSFSGANVLCRASAPANPSVSTGTVTSSSIQWSWSNVASETGYTVYDGGTLKANLGADVTSWTETGLSANTAYTRKITAKNAWGESSGTTITRYTLANTPGTPTASNVTNTSATITWAANGNASGTTYQVLRNGTTTVYSGTALSFTDTGLSPGTTYTYQVRALNGDGVGTCYTSTVSVTTYAVPGTPTLQGIGQTNIAVAWTANGNPSGATYELRRNGSTLVYTGTALTYTDTGLSPGTTYTYDVRVTNGAGWYSSYSGTLSTVTVPATPPAPAVQSSGGLSWSQTAGRGYVVLTWPAQAGASGYKLWAFDGSTYRSFDVGNTTTWDSRTARIYPAESTLDAYGDNTQSGDLFNHVQGGEDLRDTPNKLYRKTVGTQYDTANNYWFRLSAYNASGESPYSASATLVTLPNRTDTTAPIGSLSVEDGRQYTSALTVTLSIDASDPAVPNHTGDTADDASKVVEVQFSNDNEIWSPFEPLTGPKTWTLAPGEGTKTVYARVRDAAGNLSAVFSKEIYLFFDSQAPNIQMKINDGAPLTSKTSVTLNLIAADNFSGTPDLQMRFSNDWVNWSNWETYKAAKEWTVPDGDGPKVVYCQVKDKAGNVGTVYALVTLSTQPPTVNAARAASAVGETGTVYISGKPISTCFVNARKVQMTLEPAQSGSVRFSLDGLTWTEPEPALSSKTFSLPDVDGQHTVYVRFDDGQVYMQEFTLDRTPPVIDAQWLGGATVTSNGQATIVLNASDNISRRQDLMYSLDGASWQTFQNLITVNLSGSGYKVVTVYVKDQAGNVASKLLSIYNQ